MAKLVEFIPNSIFSISIGFVEKWWGATFDGIMPMSGIDVIYALPDDAFSNEL